MDFTVSLLSSLGKGLAFQLNTLESPLPHGAFCQVLEKKKKLQRDSKTYRGQTTTIIQNFHLRVT